MAVAIELIRLARSDRLLLERMMQLYAHDFSELAPRESLHGELSDDGRFPCGSLDKYFATSGHVALLTRVDGRIGGFVLVSPPFASVLPDGHAVAEFFVLRKYRRTGIGTAAARRCFRRFPGRWEVPVAHYNPPALAFWRSVLTDAGGIDELSEEPGDGRRWSGPVLRFVSRSADPV